MAKTFWVVVAKPLEGEWIINLHCRVAKRFLKVGGKINCGGGIFKKIRDVASKILHVMRDDESPKLNALLLDIHVLLVNAEFASASGMRSGARWT